jgi:hypothetical protein
MSKAAMPEALLQHPALWRGRNAAPQRSHATGFAALDAALPSGGWPCSGLVETLIPGEGSGELRLWAPLAARLSQAASARWCVFVAPPFEPYLPAWQAQGLRPERLLVARAEEPLWSLEQSLMSGACDLVFGWIKRASLRDLRRLALAAEKGATLAVLIRPLDARRESSAAHLRLAVSGLATGLRVELLKGRGLRPVCLELP